MKRIRAQGLIGLIYALAILDSPPCALFSFSISSIPGSVILGCFFSWLQVNHEKGSHIYRIYGQFYP